MRFVRSFLFWSSIAFLLLFLWTVSFGQWSNLEFRDQELRSDFYNILFDGTPLAVLATLSGTIKKAAYAFAQPAHDFRYGLRFYCCRLVLALANVYPGI